MECRHVPGAAGSIRPEPAHAAGPRLRPCLLLLIGGLVAGAPPGPDDGVAGEPTPPSEHPHRRGPPRSDPDGGANDDSGAKPAPQARTPAGPPQARLGAWASVTVVEPNVRSRGEHKRRLVTICSYTVPWIHWRSPQQSWRVSTGIALHRSAERAGGRPCALGRRAVHDHARRRPDLDQMR